MMRDKKLHRLLLLSLLGVFAWSYIDSYDRYDWWLQAAPVIMGLLLLLFTYRRFPFTRLSYILMWAFAVLLLIGAHYTYTDPLFCWIRDTLGLKRNNFDRLSHLAQGFVPAIMTREFLLRKTSLLPGKMLFFLVVSVCLAASAFYEFLEWWAALLTNTTAHTFLGTQGDVWDTQWDMFCCFLGAIASQLLLARIHDRELAQLREANVKR